MDDHLDLLDQTKAAQKRAEQAGLSDTAAALARIADMMAQKASMDRGMVLPSAPAAAPFASGRQVRH